jgi:repressor LexA
MKSTIGERLRQARERRDLDQATLASRIDVATRTVQRGEKGEQVPDGLTLTRIARATGVAASWLLTGEGGPEPRRPENIFPMPVSPRRGAQLANLPLISSVPAGRVATMFHPEQAEEFVTVDDVKDPGAFALKVKGNSMSPRIEDGDVVIVSPRQEVRNGDICVVRVSGEDTLKKVKLEGGYVHLIPLNPEFEPVTAKKKDVEFVWKVVKLIKEL